MILEQIRAHLIAQGIEGGATDDPSYWPIKIGFQPSTPNQCITLYMTPGDEPGIVKDPSIEPAYDKISFQVRVRSELNDYPGSIAKIQQVFEALHQNEPDAISGEQYFVYLYSKNSGPLPMGKDSNDRFEFTWNFYALVSRNTV